MKKDELLFLIATIIFGTNGLVSRYINVSTFFLVSIRGLIGSLFIYFVMLFKHRKLNIDSIKQNAKYLVISGLLLGLMCIFLYTGYRYSVSITCLINNTAPFFVIVISTFIYSEKLSIKQLICLLSVFLGVLLVSGILEGEIVTDIRSFIYGFLSCMCFTGMVIVNKQMRNIEPIEKTIIQLFISFLVTIVITICSSQIPASIDTKSLVFLVILGCINTGLAYLLYFDAITTLPSYKIAIIGYLEPVVSMVLGILVLHEKITPLGIIGSIIIIVSTCISEIMENK